MKTLYLDTAYNQILGVVENGQWLFHERSSGQKASAILHGTLQRACEKLGMEASDIQQVIYLAGPGFYTGLRTGYGVAETLRLLGKEILSFYAHEVPRILGETNYYWLTKAYRGEIFLHRFVEGKGVSQLVVEKGFSLVPEVGSKVYIHDPLALDGEILEKWAHSPCTENLIHGNINRLIPAWKREDPKDLFYFRAPEEEFRPNP